MKRSRHELGVLDRDAEAERAHPARVGDDAPNRLEQLGDARVVAGDDAVELLQRVSAALPAQAGEIGAVGDAEVLERDEEPLVDRLPEPELDGDAPAEELGHVLRVHPLRRRRQPEQLLRIEAVEQPAVARRRRVVELVDDDDVEVLRTRAATTSSSETDWIIAKTWRPAATRPPPWISPNDPSRRTARNVARLCSRIRSRWATNSSERSRPRSLPKLPVVERRDDGLPGPSRRDDEVAMASVTLALDRQPLEHPLLVRIRVNVEADERDARRQRRGRDGRRARGRAGRRRSPGRTARSAPTPSSSRTSSGPAR